MRDDYDLSRARRGPVVQPDRRKTRITIRLDNDVVEWFRHQAEHGGGGQYQALINLALREHVQRSKEALEDTLRRVLRQELSRFALSEKPIEG